jgi:hypothetical protein
MSNNNKIMNIILAKASWCPHCVNFTPIYEKAIENIKSVKDFKDCNITFHSFELDKEQEKNNFINQFRGLEDYVSGYPTVFIQIKDTQNPKKVLNDTVEHVTAKGVDEKSLNDASNVFINNIRNKYKSLTSDNKELHLAVQMGGMYNNRTNIEDEKYRNKYLKYKSKYLELKNN